jgi:uncharacterized membrane protein YdbT with pleckstrin-like domain
MNKDKMSKNRSVEDRNILFQTSPLIRPTLAVIGVVILVTIILIGAIWLRPDLFGGVRIAELILNGIVLLSSLVLIRLGVTLIILRRTTYTIYNTGFKKEYEFAFHKKSRELPVEQFRGRELERGRFETLFGCATIRLLTAGTNQSLGFVEFAQISNPDVADEHLNKILRENKTDTNQQ